MTRRLKIRGPARGRDRLFEGRGSAARRPCDHPFRGVASPITAGSDATITAVFADGTGRWTTESGADQRRPLSTGPLDSDTTFTLAVSNAAGERRQPRQEKT